MNYEDRKYKELSDQIAELKRDNQELTDKVENLELLVKINRILSRTLEKDETLASLKTFFGQNFEFEDYAIMLKTETEEKLEVISHSSPSLDEKIWIPLGDKKSILFRSFHDANCRYIKDLSTDYTSELANLLDQIEGSLLCLPLVPEEGRVIGLTIFYRRAPQAFSEQEITKLESIVQYAAINIDKTILFHTTKELAYTDGLTGVFNRRYFDQRYFREIVRARRYERSLSVLMIDIDRFKLYNDTFGHLMGDEVLRKVANVLELNLRRADVLCRYGGEEFVVILPEINAEQACLVAEKLRNAVINVDFAGEEKMPSHQVTISIGVSSFPQCGDSEQAVLQRADDALYRAKKTGRNKVVVLTGGEN